MNEPLLSWVGLGPVRAACLIAALGALSTRAAAPQTLDAFEVTGSRIKRIDAETPQPVVRITEADFKASGFSTLGDAIRAMPAISGGSLVSVDGGTSFTPGASSFNLRGLGNNNTLVLINGRRAAPFASAGFTGFQTIFDFNSIPTAAIESIEVLKDGASAIYGSDAVAGVINVNLKTSYTGLSTEVSFGNTLATDSAERSAFVVLGAKAGEASFVATFDASQRNSIYGRDLDYTDESDGRPYGGRDQRTAVTPVAGVRGLTDRVRFPSGNAMFAAPQSAPTLAAAQDGIPLWNFQEEAQFLPDLESLGFYARAVYQFQPSLLGFVEASFRRSQVWIAAASTPYQSLQETGTSAQGTGLLPRTNPFNPFGEDITDLRWRMSELGPRIQDSTADTPRIVAGLEGRLPLADWSWEGALLYTRNTVTHVQRNFTADALVQQAFNGVMLNGRQYHLNPFGPNPPELIKYLRVTNPNHDAFEVSGADVSVSGPVFPLPAGSVGFATGAEYRREEFANLGTDLNRDGLLVGGATTSDVYGDRELRSFYAEVSVPVLRQLEVQLAGRHENYSDFGTTTKPKVAVVFRAIPEVLVRGSYGESFLAPNLPFLHTAQNLSFTQTNLVDPLRPNDLAAPVRQFGGGNPDLKPEETKVHYAGLVVQPMARRPGHLFRELSFGVDYFDFRQENLIARLTAAQVLANLNAFGGFVTRNPPAPGESVGAISAVQTTWQNMTRGRYQGYDFNIRWILPSSELGEFRVDLSATYLDNVENTVATGALLDNDGNYNFPHTRGTATVAWKRRNWAASLFVTYVGKYSTAGSGLANLPDVKQQLLFNPQMAYRFWNSTVTVGVRNALNEDPPVDLADLKLMNDNTNFAEPAFWYVRWAKEW